MQMQGSFNAQNVEPKQGGGTNHPVGRFQSTVTSCSIEENKNKDGGYYEVEFTTPAGAAIMRYNMWNKNPQAVEIANGQLSALCHATGRYQLNWQDEGAAMRGAQCMIEVGFQKGQEPTTDKPAGGWTEIKKVLDMAGNEPGKGPAANGNTQQQVNPQQQASQQQANPQGGAPLTQQAGGSWNNQQSTGNQPDTAVQGAQGGGWQANANAGQQNPQQQNNAQQGAGWQQGGAQNGGGQTAPPWQNRQ